MKRIILLGGAGYLSGALTNILSVLPVNVRIYDNLLFEDHYRKSGDFVFGDVRDHAKLKEQLDWADIVVNLAALVGDGACALNPLATTEVNYDAVKFIADNFNGRIIHMSTCSVYGAQDELLTEDSPTNPLSLYAITKLKSEALLKDKNAVIFRLGTLYGLGDEYSRIRLDLVVNTLTAKAVGEHKLRVFGGEQYRPLLHVKDAARAILAQVDWQNHNDTGVFNLHSENMRIIDIARRVKFSVPGTEIDIAQTSFEDSRNYKVSSQKAISAFGFSPTRTVADGIKEVKELLESGRIKDLNNPRYTNQGFLSRGL